MKKILEEDYLSVNNESYNPCVGITEYSLVKLNNNTVGVILERCEGNLCIFTKDDLLNGDCVYATGLEYISQNIIAYKNYVFKCRAIYNVLNDVLVSKWDWVADNCITKECDVIKRD